MLRKFYISDVVPSKAGISAKGRKWTLYKVVDQEGKKYSTFSDSYLAMKGQEIEREVVAEPYVGKDGVERTNYKLLEPGEVPRNIGITSGGMERENAGHSAGPGNNISDRFAAIEKRLDAIEAELKRAKIDPAGEFATMEKINEADIPNLPF